MKINEWFSGEPEENGNYPTPYKTTAVAWFLLSNWIRMLHYRLFVRGVCALKGCDVHYSCGGYLPDDVCEWYCKRCHVGGINHITYSRYDVFYSDRKLPNFIAALQGK